MHKYGVVIQWSTEDDVFVADAPDLPGCMAHGDTLEEAFASITTAMGLWIETARELGEPLPEPTEYPTEPD